ncbi:hypothetical protein KO494_10180 [Lacinutrix sp. C3R15]|uniref:hypothetical protein n=1 Tax=Flavobacteriaceae TaxID=49546 RepID=UPI001C0A21EF|nr:MULTISPECIES: hypothetical protein [Flavobacteriaceae]MBU2939906.1 hypothetical protein [Lacinutrix sp. C3R15]MDO6623222.1 hypothetical protein [Oceanihabitans sp. 1_MG-2023]
MKTITQYVIGIILVCATPFAMAQENPNGLKIEYLETKKEEVKLQEKEFLKEAVAAINNKLDNGEITNEEAEELKQKEAEKHALNIENRIAIIDNKIALLERNEKVTSDVGANLDGMVIQIGKGEDSDEFDKGGIYIGPKDKATPKVYDKRTTSDMVFAIGFNNAIIEGQSLSDSPYKLGGSGFIELGWAWKTRLFKNTNAVRLKYGLSVQWNKLNVKEDQFLTENDGVVSLETSSFNLKKSKFRSTNLVVPIHFEFGPSKKIERDTYFRYSTYNKFKIGVGGYAGVNLSSMHKIKYKLDGNREKDKETDLNANPFVYGVSSYVSFGNVALYAKYDLSPLFKDQAIDQNNISLGLRFDLD